MQRDASAVLEVVADRVAQNDFEVLYNTDKDYFFNPDLAVNTRILSFARKVTRHSASDQIYFMQVNIKLDRGVGSRPLNAVIRGAPLQAKEAL